MAEFKLTLVVACALVDADKRVLIAQRPPGKALAGLWEFPGGKVEPGERPEATLIRELFEEIGITVSEPCLAPLTFASHAYEDFHLLMPLYICRRWEGNVVAREGQNLACERAKFAPSWPGLSRPSTSLQPSKGRRGCPAEWLVFGPAEPDPSAGHDEQLKSSALSSPLAPGSLSPNPASAASAGCHAAPSPTARSCRRWRGCGRRHRQSGRCRSQPSAASSCGASATAAAPRGYWSRPCAANPASARTRCRSAPRHGRHRRPAARGLRAA